MDHRRFRGEDGKTWEVWAVYPDAVERRVTDGLLSRPSANDRRQSDGKLLLPETLKQGWLAFQNGDDRRRLAPVPAGWESLSAEQLAALLRVATQAPRLEIGEG